MAKTTAVRETAPAKINLTLSVLDKRADGYHNLESLVAFARLADELEISFGAPNALILDGPFAAQTPTDESNLIFKALKFLDITASVKLTKNIPLDAGLGGGSADCAAVLRAAVRAFNLPAPRDIFSLGADVPACYLSQSLWLCGAGERVAPVALPKFACLLVKPQKSSATKKIFAAYDEVAPNNAPPETAPDLTTPTDFFNFCQTRGNDLTPFVQQSKAVLDALSTLAPAPKAYGLSGSGSSCFALFFTKDEAKVAASALARHHNFWIWA